MTRFLRTSLYWLARVAGVIGLVAGGKSLVKYALARLQDPYFDSFSYNDLVFSGGVIFLLSLLVLIFADAGQNLSSPQSPTDPGLSAKPAASPSKPSAPVSPAVPSPVSEAEVDRESADEKLARLLSQKKK